MSCGNSDILALIDYFQNGTDLSSNSWDNYNFYDLWNAVENGASPPSRPVCGTFSQADVLSVTLAVLGTLTLPSEYLGSNRDFYYLYLKAIGSEDPSPTFTNYCVYELYQVFSVGESLLLDLYPNAAAAYSIRLLSSTYSGPLVRIRKETGGNPEKDFYPDSNNELSLNSSDGGGTTLGNWIGMNNGYIVIWYSQAGVSGRDATQSSAANQAQIISSGSLLTINSKPALLGSNSYYNISVPNYSIFSKLDVYKYANLPASNEAVYGLNDGGNNNRFELRQDGTDLEFFIRENGGSFVQPAIKTQDTNQNLCTTYYDEGTVDAYINSVLELNNYSTGLSDPLFNQLTLLATDASGIFFNLDGYIQESILWGVDYSADNTEIESNVNDFFNIYV